jgi:predicted aspartyl protease
MRARTLVVFAALVTIFWAVPSTGAARFFARAVNKEPVAAAPAPPMPVRFRLEKERGILVTVWINGRGPFLFAVDTGAGTNLITQDAATRTELAVRNVRPVSLGGLSGALTSSSREVVIPELALGDRGNLVPMSKTALVVPSLASGVDGILDPIDVYAPFGFSVDMPNRMIEPSDSGNGSGRGLAAREGTVVPWLRLGATSRPFVRLGDGRLALVDTGSGFGLAVNGRNAAIVGPRNERQTRPATRDVSGGSISSRRVAPTTISIGELVLRGVPTDILFGVTDDAPVILGRDLLYPFKITFNPQKHLIEFVASSRS